MRCRMAFLQISQAALRSQTRKASSVTRGIVTSRNTRPPPPSAAGVGGSVMLESRRSRGRKARGPEDVEEMR